VAGNGFAQRRHPAGDLRGFPGDCCRRGGLFSGKSRVCPCAAAPSSRTQRLSGSAEPSAACMGMAEHGPQLTRIAVRPLVLRPYFDGIRERESGIGFGGNRLAATTLACLGPLLALLATNVA